MRSLEETLNTSISGVAVAEPQPDPASEEWADVASQNLTGDITVGITKVMSPARILQVMS